MPSLVYLRQFIIWRAFRRCSKLNNYQQVARHRSAEHKRRTLNLTYSSVSLSLFNFATRIACSIIGRWTEQLETSQISGSIHQPFYEKNLSYVFASSSSFTVFISWRLSHQSWKVKSYHLFRYSWSIYFCFSKAPSFSGQLPFIHLSLVSKDIILFFLICFNSFSLSRLALFDLLVSLSRRIIWVFLVSYFYITFRF